jgi:hypothetical protein
MRSILVHLDHSSEDDVVAALDAEYERQNGDAWILRVSGDACLYIHLYRDYDEFGPDELAHLKERFGGRLPISVIADISGRHEGRTEARRFAEILLGRWPGFADDDSGLLE